MSFRHLPEPRDQSRQIAVPAARSIVTRADQRLPAVQSAARLQAGIEAAAWRYRVLLPAAPGIAGQPAPVPVNIPVQSRCSHFEPGIRWRNVVARRAESLAGLPWLARSS